VIPILAEPRHHDAAFYGGDDVPRQHFRLDLYLQVSSVLSFPQNAGQELRPTPKDFSYQLSNSIISVAQFQSGVTKQSAANELGLPLLLEDRVEQARHSLQGTITIQTVTQKGHKVLMCLLKNGQAQFFLAGEMEVKIPFLNAGDLDDVVYARAAKPLLINQLPSGFEHSGTGFFAF